MGVAERSEVKAVPVRSCDNGPQVPKSGSSPPALSLQRRHLQQGHGRRVSEEEQAVLGSGEGLGRSSLLESLTTQEIREQGLRTLGKP